MSELEGSSISCGILEFYELDRNPKTNLLNLGYSMMHNSFDGAFIIWSDIWGRKMPGNKLYHYIRRQFPKSSIGRSIKSTNPNTRNKICLYWWRLPRSQFRKWWKENYDIDSIDYFEDEWANFLA